MFSNAGCASRSNQYSPAPPPEVTGIRPLVQDVVVFLDKNGETESAGKAEVRSRVRGIVQRIHFQSGQLVDEGAVLFSIEPDAYQAAVSAARAEVVAAQSQVLVAQANIAVNEASVEQTRNEFARQEQLLAQRVTSQAEYDSAKANLVSANATSDAARAALATANAAVLQAQAKLESAELELGYTEIRAPIRGRLTQSLVLLGNLVEPGTSLVTIIDADKLYINFTLSDREALVLADTQRQEGAQPARKGPLAWAETPVLIARETDSQFPFRGQLEYVAQEGVDANTGTLRLRATVENRAGQLLPGLFVRLRVPVALQHKAILVPETVVQTERSGKFVLIADERGKLQRRPIRLGRRLSGWVVVEQGLGADEQVISDGFHLVASGQVTVSLRSFTDSELPIQDDTEIVDLMRQR
ncbi:MAG: efflux RND transporter periplasmic adaptor subunit [Pirellulaceae bacterium]|nr:efflux RND transporter periplasmic adaptor subunit [Pirellulaceae bacterium]